MIRESFPVFLTRAVFPRKPLYKSTSPNVLNNGTRFGDMDGLHFQSVILVTSQPYLSQTGDASVTIMAQAECVIVPGDGWRVEGEEVGLGGGEGLGPTRSKLTGYCLVVGC